MPPRPEPTQSARDRCRSLPFDKDTWIQVVRVLRLSPRLASTLELLLRGTDDKGIASALGIGLPTVRTYLERLRRRLGAEDRVGVILSIFAMVVELKQTNGVCRRD